MVSGHQTELLFDLVYLSFAVLKLVYLFLLQVFDSHRKFEGIQYMFFTEVLGLNF